MEELERFQKCAGRMVRKNWHCLIWRKESWVVKITERRKIISIVMVYRAKSRWLELTLVSFPSCVCTEALQCVASESSGILILGCLLRAVWTNIFQNDACWPYLKVERLEERCESLSFLCQWTTVTFHMLVLCFSLKEQLESYQKWNVVRKLTAFKRMQTVKIKTNSSSSAACKYNFLTFMSFPNIFIYYMV